MEDIQGERKKQPDVGSLVFLFTSCVPSSNNHLKYNYSFQIIKHYMPSFINSKYTEDKDEDIIRL